MIRLVGLGAGIMLLALLAPWVMVGVGVIALWRLWK